MASARPDVTKLIELWHERFRDAKLQLDFARIYAKEVEHDLQSGQIPRADGNFARHRALRTETLALAEYERILRIYSHLVLDGDVPYETDWSRDKAVGASAGERD